MDYLFTLARDPLGTILYTVVNTLAYGSVLDLLLGITLVTVLAWASSTLIKKAIKVTELKTKVSSSILEPVCSAVLLYTVLSIWYLLGTGKISFSMPLFGIFLVLGLLGRFIGDKLTSWLNRRMKLPEPIMSLLVIFLLSGLLLSLLAAWILVNSLYFEVYYYNPYVPNSGVYAGW